MINGIKTIYPRDLNKEFSSRFCVGFRFRINTPEKDRRTYRPKRCEHINEDNSLNIVSDKNPH